MRKTVLFSSVILAAGFLTAATTFPEPPKAGSPAQAKESIVLAGGCFWGMQGVFEHVKGVTSTVVGYAGGTRQTANYDTVATRRTGHAESIKITYDPSKITY